jgi:hypothetical protein
VSGNVVSLPSRATSFYTVRQDRGAWAVQLVTPCPGKPLQTSIAWHGDRGMALVHGREVAVRMMRPFWPGSAGQ